MSHIKIELNFLQYLHEKAQESRNKEMQGCLMFLAGAVFFIGGMLESLSLIENPEWFIFIPFHPRPVAGAILGLTLTLSGLSLMVFGVVVALRWRVNRKWYMEKLQKASSKEWNELRQNRRHKISKPKTPKSNASKPKKKPSGEWWVYENLTTKPMRVKVHRGICSYCNHGKGTNPSNTVQADRKWSGPYPTWKKAWKAAQQLEQPDTAFCKKCCKKFDKLVKYRMHAVS